jgi:excisionase family DNA binding protein
MKHTPTIDEGLGLLWGAREIARELGVSPRQAIYLLENGKLPAMKLGNRWVIARARLREFFKVPPQEAA